MSNKEWTIGDVMNMLQIIAHDIESLENQLYIARNEIDVLKEKLYSNTSFESKATASSAPKATVQRLNDIPFGIIDGQNQRLLSYRQQMFDTQAAAARAMGIHQPYLSQAEHGKHVPSRIQNIIAETYGVAPEDLFPDYQ